MCLIISFFLIISLVTMVMDDEKSGGRPLATPVDSSVVTAPESSVITEPTKKKSNTTGIHSKPSPSDKSTSKNIPLSSPSTTPSISHPPPITQKKEVPSSSKNVKVKSKSKSRSPPRATKLKKSSPPRQKSSSK